MKLTIEETDVSVDHEEITSPEESPSVEYSQTKYEATRVLQCAWAESTILASQLVTGVSKSGLNIVLKKGQVFPNYTGNVALICDHVSIRPAGLSGPGGGNTSIASWSHANLTAHYSVFPKNGLFYLIRENFTPVLQFLTRPGRLLYWDSAKTKQLGNDEAPGLLISQGEWSYTIKQMPYIPEYVYTLQGKVNSVAMSSPTYSRTFPVGTILYNAPEITDYVGFSGEPQFDITLKFAYNASTWNLFFKAGAVTPQKIYDSSGSEFKQYPEANLNDLLLT